IVLDGDAVIGEAEPLREQLEPARQIRLRLGAERIDTLPFGELGVPGARPLQRLIRFELEDQLAGLLLFGALEKGGRVVADAESADAEHLTLTPYGE
ncbi:MAG: hypothetical protein IKS68_08120, partial [Mailhella sp.]|nr:hypothetical protein [Mailhella sp.]